MSNTIVKRIGEKAGTAISEQLADSVTDSVTEKASSSIQRKIINAAVGTVGGAMAGGIFGGLAAEASDDSEFSEGAKTGALIGGTIGLGAGLAYSNLSNLKIAGKISKKGLDGQGLIGIGTTKDIGVDFYADPDGNVIGSRDYNSPKMKFGRTKDDIMNKASNLKSNIKAMMNTRIDNGPIDESNIIDLDDDQYNFN